MKLLHPHPHPTSFTVKGGEAVPQRDHSRFRLSPRGGASVADAASHTTTLEGACWWRIRPKLLRTFGAGTLRRLWCVRPPLLSPDFAQEGVGLRRFMSLEGKRTGDHFSRRRTACLRGCVAGALNERLAGLEASGPARHTQRGWEKLENPKAKSRKMVRQMWSNETCIKR